MGKPVKKVRTRAYLFSPERPDKGVLFQSEDAIATALEQGWAESPAEAAEDAKSAEGKKPAGKSTSKSGGTQKVTAGDNS